MLTSESNLNSAIITISVGPSQRLFAAHEDVLCKSTHFAQFCRSQFFETNGKRIELPNEEPEIFSAVLEYLYKGDYTPKLSYDKKRASWYLEDADVSVGENTIHHTGVGGSVLKDTIIYVRIERCPSHLRANSIAVLCSPLQSVRPATSRTQEARLAVWCAMQHHIVVGSFRLCQHTGIGLQVAGTLPRSHHSLSQHV